MVTAALGMAHAVLILVAWLLMTTVPRLSQDVGAVYLDEVRRPQRLGSIRVPPWRSWTCQ